ncbi:hypothetical protein [Ensifer soli]
MTTENTRQKPGDVEVKIPIADTAPSIVAEATKAIRKWKAVYDRPASD